MTFPRQRGNTLVEILLASTILVIVITAFIGALANLGFVQVKAKLQSESVQLAREYVEIAYNLSLQDWETFRQLEGTYTIQAKNSPNYDEPFPWYDLQNAPISSEEKIIRTITFSPVYRDGQGKITDNPGSGDTQDVDTRKITVNAKVKDVDGLEETVFETYVMNFGGTQ